MPWGALASFVLGLLSGPVKGYVDDRATRRAFEQAVKHACRAFEASHPSLRYVFFDTTFVQSHLAPLLSTFLLNRGQLPAADAIAVEWQSAYGWGDGELDSVAAGAADFIRELSRQMAAEKRLQPFIDRSMWDRSAQHLEGIDNHTSQLANDYHRAQIEKGLVALYAAALDFSDAAQSLSEGRPTEARFAAKQAQLQQFSGERLLRTFEYIAVASLLADFHLLIFAPYDGRPDDIDEPTAKQLATQLKAGCAEWRGILSEAP